MIKHDCDVLVIGAGPVGLATTLSLLVQGVDVQIIDDMPARHATARASAIHARTLELLAPFGVADRIAAYAQPIRHIKFYTRKGEEFYRRTLQSVDSQFPAQQNFQQWQVEWMLAEQLSARGVTIHSSTSFMDYKEDGNGLIALAKTDDGSVEIKCKFLVGADGARSTVRKSCKARMIGKDYPEVWIGAELEIDHSSVLTDVRAFFGERNFGFSLPLDGGLMFFAILDKEECPVDRNQPPESSRIDAVFRATFGGFPHLTSEIKSVKWSGYFEMHECCVPNFRIGRVFLAGDAAHLVSAAGGYGMNGGIQDGINLAWRLAAHLRLNANEAILDGYNVDRQEMFSYFSSLSDQMHMVMASRNPAIFSDPKFQTSAFMQAANRSVAEIDLAYTRDAMFRDDATSGDLRAGMRVPTTSDLATGEGASRSWASLYDGFNWTVILAVSDRTAVRTSDIRRYDLSALVWLNGRVRMVVAAGEAFEWNSPRPTLYVVRPDGYVAFRCDSASSELPDVKKLSAWFIDTFA